MSKKGTIVISIVSASHDPVVKAFDADVFWYQKTKLKSSTDQNLISFLNISKDKAEQIIKDLGLTKVSEGPISGVTITEYE